MKKWEYCTLVATRVKIEDPITVLYMTVEGNKVEQFPAKIQKSFWSGDKDEGTLSSALAALGIQGWEMYAITEGLYHLKREITT